LQAIRLAGFELHGARLPTAIGGDADRRPAGRERLAGDEVDRDARHFDAVFQFVCEHLPLARELREIRLIELTKLGVEF